MHRTTRASTSVEEESLALVIIIQHEVQVSVGEEDLTPHKVCRVPQDAFESFCERPRYRLGSKVSD